LTCMAQDDVLPEHYQRFSFAVVRIPVWVSDRNGLPYADLEADDFELLVDDHPVVIDNVLLTHDAPMEMVYLIDLSGSMAMGGKLEGTIQTLDWLLRMHGPEDRWRIIAFSDGQILQVANEQQPEEWTRIKPLLRGFGKTALFDTLGALHHYFGPDSLNNRAVLAFTDGNDNHSTLDEDHLLRALHVIQVPLFVVGICDGFVPHSEEDQEKLGLQTLRNIATITGGSLFLAESADHLPIIGRILREKMRPQYMLTMTVEQSDREERHGLTVRLVRKRPYQLRYRQGYLGSVPQYRGGFR